MLLFKIAKATADLRQRITDIRDVEELKAEHEHSLARICCDKGGARVGYRYTFIFFCMHRLFLAEPGKEIEIITSRLTIMCFKY